MTSKSTRGQKASLLLAASALSLTVFSPMAMAGDNFGEALKDGKLILDMRLRHEGVSQDPFTEDASAQTLRTRLGYETGDYYGFKFLAEFEHSGNVLEENYYNTVNDKGLTHPTVADPDTSELNRAQFTYTGVDGFAVIGGRQRINLGNQRFIGAVGWRQNEQTFDALVLQNTMIDNWTFTYGYIDRVHRILGDDHPAGNLDTVAHAINVDTKVGPVGAITAYGYFLDVTDVPGLSTATYGARVHGKTKLEDLTVSWDGEFAKQSDYADNTLDIDANFYSINVGVSAMGFAGKVGYDVLGGDGMTSFQTPLATLHKWQGFADAFLSTPVDGLKDTHVNVSWSKKDVGVLKSLKVAAWYHNFKGDDSDLDMGSEMDFLVAAGLGNGWSTLLKYADYSGETFQADRQKLWLALAYKY